MLDSAQLAALAAVHRRGSFDLAAADLGVTPSAVSQRLKALEERVGTLLIRRGQPSVATESGLRLIRHFDEISLLEGSLAKDLPALAQQPATLRIAVNADSLATWVLPALAMVPDHLFDLVIDDQDVSQDWLRRGEVMGAITSHAGPLQGCDTLPLGALRYLATASPDFMARHFPNGPRFSDFAKAPSFLFSKDDKLQEIWLRQRFGLLPSPVLPSHRFASSQGFVDGCLLGMGWGMNPLSAVRPHLESGALVEVMPDTPLDVPLYWQYSRVTAGALAPLTKALLKAGHAALERFRR